MEIRFEAKKRVAFRGVSRRKSLPSVMGLTRGSNHVVLAANPLSECERLGGPLDASPRFTQTGTSNQWVCASWYRWKRPVVIQSPVKNR